MELAVLPEGVYPLFKLLKELEAAEGSKSFSSNLKKSPQTYLELLKKLNKRYVAPNKHFVADRGDWSSHNFESYLNDIRLTPFQRNILEILIEANSSITLEQLKDKIEQDYNIDIKNGSQIGGCIAGITKKCDAEGVPRFVNIQNFGVGRYKYSLSFDPSLRAAIYNYLQTLDAWDNPPAKGKNKPSKKTA